MWGWQTHGPPATFPPSWSGCSAAFIVKVESAGSVAMLRGLCVCEWDCREWVEGTSFPLPTLSRTTIVLEAGLTSAFWERCDYQDGFSIVGFLKSKDYMDSYLATARHFCRPRAPGPSNAEFP